MEEMRATAMAYYANMSDNQKQEVGSFFRSLDKNGDGKVSVQEYMEFVKTRGGDGERFYPPNLFKLLDKNNDGNLDFAECVTLFYMSIGSRMVLCDGCGCFLWGLHFLCVQCYNANGKTYDLCTSCYRNQNHNHAHDHFMDNYALLRNKPWTVPTSVNVHRSVSTQVPPTEIVQKSVSKRATVKGAIKVIGQNVAVAATRSAVEVVADEVVGGVVDVIAAVVCSIM